MTSGIYCIQNVISGKRYIGSAINVSSRWRIHKYVLGKNKHHSQYLQHAWKKYGATVFEWTVLEECSPEMLTIREQIWMNYYQSYDRSFGYNICPTAGSLFGTKHSQESKRKTSEALRGRKHSDETKRKISMAHIGIRPSEETKRKISISKSGENCSFETRQKISKAKLGRKASEKTKLKMSKSQTGRVHSEETKQKISNARNRRASSSSKEQVLK